MPKSGLLILIKLHTGHADLQIKGVKRYSDVTPGMYTVYGSASVASRKVSANCVVK